MHPVLFRIPLPDQVSPAWLILGFAALALVIAVWQWFAGNKVATAIAGGLAVAAVVVRFVWSASATTTWELGELPIYSYGVMLGLSLVVGWYLTLGLAERDGLPKETMANCYVITAIAAIVGSRVLYVLTNLSEFDSFGSIFAMRRGGLVAYGGFLGGLLGSWLYLRSHNLPLLPWGDVAVPSLASGLLLTRIGCYLFGCDFGKPLSDQAPAWLKKLGSFPHWADGTIAHGSGSPAWVQHVKERGLSHAATHSLPVHPTQIYESLVGLGLLVLLLSWRRRQKFRGEIMLLFWFAYAVCRYLLEVLRDDAERGSLPPALPEHVLIPVGLAVLGLGYVIGFSQTIRNEAIRRVSQVAAFLPAVAFYVALKPESFAGSLSLQFSTSQAVAIGTGFVGALVYSALYRGALAHPEAAMALPVPAGALAGAGGGERVADADEDEDEDDDTNARAPKPQKRDAAAKAPRAADDKAPAARAADRQGKPKPAKKAAPGKRDGEPEEEQEQEGGEAAEKRQDAAAGASGDEVPEPRKNEKAPAEKGASDPAEDA